ncbi:MFS transporter [Bacillus massiliigorillae]|uniref:MFS transporter n=1 Tax=Bacillus massiliigorillae TaxID=1243664 RepID=UPI0003A79F2C
MKKNNQTVSKWCLVSMASIPLVMTLGNSMLIPALPLIEKQLHISAFKSSLLITCYSIASILLIPIAGYLSDKYGRKKIILPSLAIVLIGGLVSGFAASNMEHPYWMIIVGRILQGIGAAGAAPIVLPLIGDLYKNDDDASSALGIIETSNTFGKVLSPILGAVFAAIIWYLPFYLISLFSIISFILICIFVKTPKKK